MLLVIVCPLPLFPALLLLCEPLYDEWLYTMNACYQQRGCCRISSHGDVFYLHQRGGIRYVRPLTRWVMILRVESLPVSWLIISRDSCTDHSYRQLKMFTYLYFSRR